LKMKYKLNLFLLFTDLPGFTRSVYERDHALITPESHVFSPLPEWYCSFSFLWISIYFKEIRCYSHSNLCVQDKYIGGISNDASYGFPLCDVPRKDARFSLLNYFMFLFVIDHLLYFIFCPGCLMSCFFFFWLEAG